MEALGNCPVCHPPLNPALGCTVCTGGVCANSSTLRGPVHPVHLALRAPPRRRPRGHRRSRGVADVRAVRPVLLPAARRRRLLLASVQAEQRRTDRHLSALRAEKPPRARSNATVRGVSRQHTCATSGVI